MTHDKTEALNQATEGHVASPSPNDVILPQPSVLAKFHTATDQLFDWSQTRSGKKWLWYGGGTAVIISTAAAFLAFIPGDSSEPTVPTIPAEVQADITQMLKDGVLTPEQATQYALSLTGRAFPETAISELANLPKDSAESRFKNSVETLATSSDNARRNALALINNSSTRSAGFDALEALAKSIEDWRQIGELAYPWDTETATKAYANATKMGSKYVSDYIYLARLEQRGGNMNAAKVAATTGLEKVSSDVNKAALLDELGNVAVAQGDLAAARKAYQDGLNIRERLADADTSNTGFQRDLSVSYNKIGNVAVAQGDLAAARKAYQDSLNIAERLADADTSNTGFQRDLSVSYERIGDVAVAQGDLAAARKAYQDGLNIAERLADADTSNTGFQRDLSVSYNKIGDVAVAQGDLAAARKAYQDGLNIAERLADADTSNTGFQRDLSISYERIGDVAVAQGDLAAARKAYQDGLNIAERLADADTSNTGFQRDVAASHFRLAQVNEPKALFHLAESYKIMKSLKDTGRLRPVDQPILDMLEDKVKTFEE